MLQDCSCKTSPFGRLGTSLILSSVWANAERSAQVLAIANVHSSRTGWRKVLCQPVHWRRKISSILSSAEMEQDEGGQEGV